MRNAVRLPIGIDPSLTRRPPNHSTATLERLRITISTGRARAKIRFTRRAVEVRSVFASPKRWRSDRLRTKARMTRTPVICSRSTWLIRSILTCMVRNCGTTSVITVPMNRAIRGTATTSRSDSDPPSRMARTTPPMLMMGAMTMSVSAICKNNWTCWMSLVLRVMSDGVPKWFISRAEKPWTRANTAPRTSAPTPIDTRLAQYTAMTETTPSTKVMASMTPPVVQM